MIKNWNGDDQAAMRKPVHRPPLTPRPLSRQRPLERQGTLPAPGLSSAAAAPVQQTRDLLRLGQGPGPPPSFRTEIPAHYIPLT